MSANNSPHFVTSDDEHLETEQRLDTAARFELLDEKSYDEYELPPKQPRISQETSRLPAGFGLVSYESEDEEIKTDSHTIISDIHQKFSLSIPTRGPEDTLSSEGENENGSLPFVISNGALTVLSSEHTLSDVQAVKDAMQLKNIPPISSKLSTEAKILMSAETASADSVNVLKTLPNEIVLPPEPPGTCDPALQQKVESVIEHMRHDITYDPNMQIQDNKHFRNPSMYEKLITFLKIDEKGTNFSPDVYNPYRWSSLSYYDELSKVQNREIEKLEKIRKDQRRADASGTVSSSTSATQPSMPRASSGPSLVSKLDSGDKPNTTDAEGSIFTGFVEPKKRSKWDAYVAPPTSNSPTDEDPETLELRNIALASKITIPAVGSLVRKK